MSRQNRRYTVEETLDETSPAAFIGPICSLGTPKPTHMLDTNICIYIMKKDPAVLARFRACPANSLCMSSIALAELRFGVSNSQQPSRNRNSLSAFLNLVQVLPFDEFPTNDYGEIRNYLKRQGTPIGPLDTLIAAHALSLDLTLVTNNTKEFSRIPGLRLENWID